jgi:glycerol 3-phosphatase-2
VTQPDDLLAAYDALLLDLDGTVYRGGEAVPGAAEAIEASRGRGVGIRYVTNNASRKPGSVAAHLNELGFQAADEEVSTSSQAAAAVLADRLDQGALVLIIGTQALADEVEAVGLATTREYSPEVAAVVQGHSPDTGWRDLAEAGIAIRGGAFWVACNVDATLPTERGLLPGNGSMVAALRTGTDADPVVAGKPARPLMDQAIRSAAARRPRCCGPSPSCAPATSPPTWAACWSPCRTWRSPSSPAGTCRSTATRSPSPAPATRWRCCAACARRGGRPAAARQPFGPATRRQ